MADDDRDEVAPVEPARNERDILERAVSEVRERRSNPLPDPEVEREEAPAVKLSDDGTDPLSVRKGARLLTELRKAEAERAAGYAVAAEAAQRLEGAPGPGEPSAEQQPTDPDLDLQQRHAAAEAERQALAEERALSQRISTLQGAEQHLAMTLERALPEFRQQFADVQTLSDVENLQRSDPARFAQFQNYAHALANGMGQLKELGKERYETAKGDFERRATENDQYWESMHPELKADPGKYQEVIAGAEAALKHIGLDGEDLRRLWSGEATISLRDWRVQEILHLAGLQMRGRAVLEQSRANARNGRELKPVVRPGVAPDRADRAYQALEKAERALARDPSGRAGLRAGVQHMQALRKAGRL